MDAIFILSIVYQTLWLWELVGIMFYFLYKIVLQPLGKFEAVRLQFRGGGWFYGGSKWVPLGARKWSANGHESHTSEVEAMAYSKGVHPVVLYNIKGTRPLQVVIKDTAHDYKAKSYNPDSEEFDLYATKEGLSQSLKANAIQHASPILLIMVGGIGLAFGVLLAPYILPAAPAIAQTRVIP